jgi:hypothetical protein
MIYFRVKVKFCSCDFVLFDGNPPVKHAKSEFKIITGSLQVLFVSKQLKIAYAVL